MFILTPLDARVAGFTLEESSNYIAEVTEKALKQAWQERQPNYIIKQAKLAGVLILSSIVISTIIWALRRQLKKKEVALREQKISCDNRMTANMMAMRTDEEEVSCTGYCHELATEQLHNRRMLGSQRLQTYLLHVTQVAIWIGAIALILGLFPFTADLIGGIAGVTESGVTESGVTESGGRSLLRKWFPVFRMS